MTDYIHSYVWLMKDFAFHKDCQCLHKVSGLICGWNSSASVLSVLQLKLALRGATDYKISSELTK